ncbi:multidrug efflux MATE transporter NorM, partial [Neisseria sp. P0015.S002]
ASVAAQQVVLSLSGILEMVPQRVGSARTVRVGVSLGRRDWLRARYISGVSVVLGWGRATCPARLLVVCRFQLAGVSR